MSSSSTAAPTFTIRPTSKFVIFSYALIAGLTAIGAVLAYRNAARKEYFYGIVGAGLLCLLWTAKRHIRLQLTRLTLDGQGLKFQDGFISKSTRMVNLSKIQDVRVVQGITDRLLGIGTITLETAGETGRLVMENVDQPQEIANRILSLAQTPGGRK
jgi:uncharacterized membrane protein YdbT with pleckstrin-like domain